MTAVFLKLLEMSLAAGWLVLVVLVLRVVLKRAPRAIVCALWALVAVRLVCPFSIEAPWSLMPPTYAVSEPTSPVTDAVTDPVTVPSRPAAPSVPPSVSEETVREDLTERPPATSDRAVDWWAVASYGWLAGAAVMLTYAVVSTLRLRRRVRAAMRIERRVYLCDEIDTPFILGVIRPRIYLPSTLSEEERAYVLAHERAHLGRGDHIIKPFGFLLLSLYWFHPLLWVAYILLCRDVEQACDERVIRTMEGGDRAQYASTLLRCSVPRRAVTACPLAFGESAVKRRIRAIADYRKPTFWIVTAAVVALIAAALFFLLDPLSGKETAVTSEGVPHYFAPFAKVCTDGETMGYAVMDTDGDGQAELIVGPCDSDEVTALYAWSGGQVHQLFYADTGDSYRLYTDGYVKRSESNGGFELFRIEGEELLVTEQVMYSPQYGEQIGSAASWFRADPDMKWAYLPISEEEARSVEAAFDEAHTPLTISYTSCSEPMTIDVNDSAPLTCRYAVSDGEEQTVAATQATELYTYILSVPWEQSPLAEIYAENTAIRLEFLEDTGRSYGTFYLSEDDLLTYSGPSYMPLKWAGQVPKGTCRAVLERLTTPQAPSDKGNAFASEPLSLTGDRLTRTADWQTAGLASIGLDGVTVQPYAQGALGKVYLLSPVELDFSKEVYVPWTVAVETEDTVFLVPPSSVLSRPIRVDVADMTGDGVEELLVSQSPGGQGGLGVVEAAVYTLTADGLTVLFEQRPQSTDGASGFEAEVTEDGVTVRHLSAGYEESFSLSNPNKAPLHFENSLVYVKAQDTDRDGVYELYTESYAYLDYRTNGVGRGVTVQTFDGTQFVVKEAWFEPDVDRVTQSTLTTPEFMLFRGKSQPDLLVRRGEDGCSLWVDLAGAEGPWRVPVDEAHIAHRNKAHEEAYYGNENTEDHGYEYSLVIVAHDGYVDMVARNDWLQMQAMVVIDDYAEALHAETVEKLTMSAEEIAAMWPTAADLTLRPSVKPIEVPPTEGEVKLQIPTEVQSQGCFHWSTVRVTGDRTLAIADHMSETARTVTLTEEQTAYLNACFAAVTDFSESDVFEGSTTDYTIRYRQQTYVVCIPKDYALERFLRELFSL